MRLKTFLWIPLSAFVMASCDFLDFDETNARNTDENIYSGWSGVNNLMNGVYTYLPQDFGTVSGAMRDCGSDDAEYGKADAVVQAFNDGSWSATNTVDDMLSLYDGIRAANNFLENYTKFDIEKYKYDTNYSSWSQMLKYYPYEARLLRAFYLFELARRYGDIPMPLYTMTPEEANSLPKTPFGEVIEFIVKECDEAAPNLPLDPYQSETGRVTRGFALAVKSKALLYAASKLHNPSGDAEKWKRSASAALSLINLNKYQLDPEGAPNNVSSKEVVLFRMNPTSSSFELNNYPIQFTNGKRSDPATSTFPSQNLVDAFETINGYTVTLGENGWITEDSDFDPSAPYENRDPRLAKTVLYDGATFKGRELAIYEGGEDDLPLASGGSPTGYFIRKYLQETVNFTSNAETTALHFWVIYRYAETLLTYAESMVEAFGDPDYKDAQYTLSAREALNQVRANAGMPDVTSTDKDEFIERLRNEWRVEFAFEDHRFWDVRRWMIGEDTQKEIYGVSITKDDDTYSYEKFLYERREWKDCMNLYPIPQKELYINRNLLPQNTGW